MAYEPKTLQEAIIYFSDQDNCLNYLAAKRWPNGIPVCPTCGSDRVTFMASRRVWQCKARHPKAQFSIKVGTIFEDSPISLDKWLTAMWLLANCKNGISSYEISRDLEISQKSAWHMVHRIRAAVQDEKTGGKLSGDVEVDETYIGAKARNMHKDRRLRKNVQGPTKGKTVVLGVLERKGHVRTAVIPDRTKKVMQENVREHVAVGSRIFSDEAVSNWRMDDDYAHSVINHAEAYAVGNVHTNGLENYWSLLKRGLKGTYVSVEPFHLFRYMDEQAFRYNTRKDADGAKITDGERFSMAVSQIVGKRLTWDRLTGKEADRPEAIN
jgi:transposase-like protein